MRTTPTNTKVQQRRYSANKYYQWEMWRWEIQLYWCTFLLNRSSRKNVFNSSLPSPNNITYLPSPSTRLIRWNNVGARFDLNFTRQYIISDAFCERATSQSRCSLCLLLFDISIGTDVHHSSKSQSPTSCAVVSLGELKNSNAESRGQQRHH